MKKIWNAIKIILQVFKCFHCAHKQDCPYSCYVIYKGVRYAITLTPQRDDKESDVK